MKAIREDTKQVEWDIPENLIVECQWLVAPEKNDIGELTRVIEINAANQIFCFKTHNTLVDIIREKQSKVVAPK